MTLAQINNLLKNIQTNFYTEEKSFSLNYFYSGKNLQVSMYNANNGIELFLEFKKNIFNYYVQIGTGDLILQSWTKIPKNLYLTFEYLANSYLEDLRTEKDKKIARIFNL